uniref:GTP-binding protein n=1 Tax=Meloidogyne javanica TaxID=6303 RepID=A0A915MIH7_MELJA
MANRAFCRQDEEYEYGLKDDETDSVYSVGYRPTIVFFYYKFFSKKLFLGHNGAEKKRKDVNKKSGVPKDEPKRDAFCRKHSEDVSDSFINFETIEFPGQVDPFEASFDPNSIFSRCGALLFVIDAQADYDDALKKMVPAIIRSYSINKNIKFEVFVHKVDGLSDETKMETHRKIFQTVQDDLADQGMDHIRINYHMTSVQMLKNHFYLMLQATYELCCDMIDVTIDISSIYGHKVDQQNNNKQQIQHQNRPFDQDTSAMIMLRTRQVIFLRQINVYLALVAVIKEDNFEKQGLIDFNFNVFRQGVEEVFELGKKRNSLAL